MSLSLKQICRLYLEYSMDNLLAMINQILKSPELISETNRISPEDMRNIKSQLKSIANEVIDKEISYYFKRYKIKEAKGFVSLFEKLSANNLKENRQKIARELIKKHLEK